MGSGIKFSLSLPIDRLAFNIFSPFPGTETYEVLREKNDYKKYRNSDVLSVDYVPKGRRKRELIFLTLSGYLRFYLRPKILWGIVKEIKSISQIKMTISRLLACFR